MMRPTNLPGLRTATPAAQDVRVSPRLKAAAVAVLLGVTLLFATGLADADALHQAAHDARHGLGFPCH